MCARHNTKGLSCGFSMNWNEGLSEDDARELAHGVLDVARAGV